MGDLSAPAEVIDRRSQGSQNAGPVLSGLAQFLTFSPLEESLQAVERRASATRGCSEACLGSGLCGCCEGGQK